MKFWILTHSGIQFDLENPTPEMVNIQDIAKALSQMCRFNGHCDRFYSVAEHSLRVAEKVPKHLQLQALLHDAAEAYIPDVTRPLKRMLPLFKQTERKIMQAIGAKFNMSLPICDDVTKADMRMLKTEKKILFSEEAAQHAWDPDIESLQPYNDWVNFDLSSIRRTFLARIENALYF